MSVIAASPKIIRLQYDDNQSVMLESYDGDRMILPSNDVIEFCKLMEIGQQTQQRVLAIVVNRVKEWLRDNHDRVQEVIFASKGDRLQMLAMMRGIKYDPELEDRLTSLDLEIAQDEQLQLCKLDVIAVPNFGPESATAFLQQ